MPLVSFLWHSGVLHSTERHLTEFSGSTTPIAFLSTAWFFLKISFERLNFWPVVINGYRLDVTNILIPKAFELHTLKKLKCELCSMLCKLTTLTYTHILYHECKNFTIWKSITLVWFYIWGIRQLILFFCAILNLCNWHTNWQSHIALGI